MTTALLSSQIDTFFGVLINDLSCSLTRRSVHPVSPALLTKDGPLVGLAFKTNLLLRKIDLIAN